MSRIYSELNHCQICPHACKVNRYQELGFCQAGADIKVNLHQLHFGEEPVLSGTRGSGTIFFSHCNLRCVFCQNYTISDLGWGKERTAEQCVEIMLALQKQGAHNINLVTPSHYSIQLADVIKLAKQGGLSIPVVWNSNGYENVEILKSLEGLVDIYLPDFKYADGKQSAIYSHASDYPEVVRKALLEMKRQVGKLKCDEAGIAGKGLIIRLLVLPDKIAGTQETLQWIADALGEDTYISLMAQYYPAWKADMFPKINRGITPSEYAEVLSTLERLGFDNGFTQELSSSDAWTPEFKQSETVIPDLDTA
jgi:putative pyruvate formate lyase activating enzyme